MDGQIWSKWCHPCFPHDARNHLCWRPRRSSDGLKVRPDRPWLDPQGLPMDERAHHVCRARLWSCLDWAVALSNKATSTSIRIGALGWRCRKCVLGHYAVLSFSFPGELFARPGDRRCRSVYGANERPQSNRRLPPDAGKLPNVYEFGRQNQQRPFVPGGWLLCGQESHAMDEGGHILLWTCLSLGMLYTYLVWQTWRMRYARTEVWHLHNSNIESGNFLSGCIWGH